MEENHQNTRYNGMKYNGGLNLFHSYKIQSNGKLWKNYALICRVKSLSRSRSPDNSIVPPMLSKILIKMMEQYLQFKVTVDFIDGRCLGDSDHGLG